MKCIYVTANFVYTNIYIYLQTVHDKLLLLVVITSIKEVMVFCSVCLSAKGLDFPRFWLRLSVTKYLDLLRLRLGLSVTTKNWTQIITKKWTRIFCHY